MKRSIWFCQVNHKYGAAVYLPFSVGMLQAYAQSIPEIQDAYDFKGFIYLREPIADVVERTRGIDVFGVSCYVWNWTYSNAVARAVKEANPDCLVVFGGPHCPVRSENFFHAHPYVDVVVHYEGEITFAEVLRVQLCEQPQLETVKGLSIRGPGNVTIRTPPRERIVELNRLPSPYLSGVFDGLMAQPFEYAASSETHRGCPYSCT